MAFDPTYSFEYLKRLVSIEQVLEAHGLNTHLRKRGDELVGPCPLHQGDNPTAFRVHVERDIWHCWTACGGGDVVDLVRRIHRCGYAQAAGILRSLAGNRRVPQVLPISSPKPAVRKDVFSPFELTISLDPEVPFLQRAKGISVDTARRFEAGAPTRSASLQGTVAVRLHDLTGHPLGYCGRRLDPEQISRLGKWLFPNHFPKSACLFGAHRAWPFREHGIVVVECPWAAMRLSQAGVPGAVALLGTRMSDIQAAWLAHAPIVRLLLDGDAPGRKASSLIAPILSRQTRVSIHELPDGAEPEDLDDTDLRTLVREPSSLLNQYDLHRWMPKVVPE